jgi:uncharacterized linocin/CFP29 family protein
LNHLNRELAPLVPAAWREIDDNARHALKRTLAGRKLVDFSGPHGWEHSAVGLGRVASIGIGVGDAVAAVRRSQPLVEITVPFAVARSETEAIARGARDADVDAAVDAARTAAICEDTAIFEGMAQAGISGIFESAPESLTLTDDYDKYPQVVAAALTRLRRSGIDGPYAIALGPRCYQGLTETTNRGGYPVINMVRQQVDDRIIWAPAIRGAVVLSTRGGDFELVVGQDFAIGYTAHDAQRVQLYVQETMTFVVRTPDAAVPLVYAEPAAATARGERDATARARARRVARSKRRAR